MLEQGRTRLAQGTGWSLHLIADHYPNDAQEVDDEVWMAEGLERGWSLLTQDDRIIYQDKALEHLRQHDGHAFCLSSARLFTRDKAIRFNTPQASIYRMARRASYGFSVQADQVLRKWPRPGKRGHRDP